MVQEHLHVGCRIVALQNNGIAVLCAMVVVEEFLTEVLESLERDFACDDDVRDFRVGLVDLASVEALHVHEGEKLVGLSRKHDEGKGDHEHDDHLRDIR